jgi:metal transporter CNNM
MWYHIVTVIVLVILAGTYSGLTLALFGMRLSMLEAKTKTGDERAASIYKLRKKGNLLLCTLLLGNAASYTTMGIFLGSITTGVVAGFTGTLLIFIFGEILPQAIFPRHALVIGSKLIWFIWLSLIIFYPLSAPIAWFLDKMLGKETLKLPSKIEFEEFIKLLQMKGAGIIDEDERRIILGALSFSEMEVVDVMIPKKDVFYLDSITVIESQILMLIKEKGFSRIPVYDSNNHIIKGILYAKNLIGVEPGMKASELCVASDLAIVRENIKLDDLEDIMEEILKTEIEEKD